jgi:DNA helicase II / ATP-dependent DNA helicase PcrA
MSAWSEVRRLAQLRHTELAGSTDNLVPAATLLNAAENATGVRRLARPPGDALLDGAEAAYDRERLRIYYSKATELALVHFHMAHEYGHHWLDEAGAVCHSTDLDVATSAEPSMSLVGDADGYSPKERAEAMANLFAREFLLPRDKVRRRYSQGMVEAASLAAELMLPVDLVMQQMADALLLPEEIAATPQDRAEQTPDASQLEAIQAPPGPRQVRAGPGSGKTRTLVGRVAYLVSEGEEPSSILALTYSNASAQDLASRIRAAIGQKATAVWSGTFHAYGRELLRKYGREIGLPVEPKVLDRTDCLMLLEEILPDLPLNHYLDLREPVLKLRPILGAIGRAKDELATPEDYERYAQAMLAAALDQKAHETAERAIEVARVYAVYERTLRARGFVDLSDLVARPVELLRVHPAIRDAVRADKRHILVDEYQDMNRASGVLLKELVQPGQGPWVVGDVRQAIYRFRGASPLNMSRFSDDFPGARTTDLSINYRSGGRIVRAFETFGGQMATAALVSQDKLQAQRGEHAGEVLYEIASTREAEANGIAKAIRDRVAAGDRFGNHAVLARSHTILARLAGELERAGVPCLYFGDFFERPEIRDLLALISVVAEPRGIGLLRVAQMPQYAVPPDDIAIAFAWRRAQRVTMLAAVRRFAEIDGLSDVGREGLRRLSEAIRDVEWPMSPHRFLMSYLFRHSAHLQRLVADGSVAGQQRRLAVYQALLFAFSFRPPAGADPKRAFLEHVRRLEILDEEKQLRQLPPAASDIDAVRLMTVHASKGLEFPVVHMPALTARHFPAPARPESCPPPDGMISADALMSRDAEEDSLFFVGISRARNALILSRALAYGGWSTKNASRLLRPIAMHLPKALDGLAAWTAEGLPEPPWPILAGQPASNEWTVRAIETYLDCPLRFYYDHVLDLRGGEEQSPFLQFQSALHTSMAWMRTAASAEERRAGITARFEEDWASFGPQGHAFEHLYRAAAQRMINQAAAVMDGESLVAERSVTLPRTGAVVTCRADHIQLTPQGVMVRRLKTGRLAKSETPKARYVLWQAAVRIDHPDLPVEFEHVSLVTGDRQTATLDPGKIPDGLRKIEAAIEAVNAGRFQPAPSDRCPTCPHYFVCPTHGTIR